MWRSRSAAWSISTRDIPAERAAHDPRVLLVAPMSGHFATLLRGTVETLLPDHEVYITDWLDARDVPLSAGSFDLDDYIDYMTDIFRHFGGDVHVFAVCQPSVPVMAAAALMEAEGDPYVPRSLILAGGPIDTRVSPTVVNTLAERARHRLVPPQRHHHVPGPGLGCGRGSIRASCSYGFMTMNLDRHVKAHKDMFLHLVKGDGDSAEKHREFYDEYLAVMDLTAEFYLQTIDSVFVKHQLPRGADATPPAPPSILRDHPATALMTVEGEKDDITGIGQCRAAHALCPNIPPTARCTGSSPGVGHYGIFNGSRFRAEIAPRIAQFVRMNDVRASQIAGNAGDRPDGGRRRANGHAHEISSVASTFAPANDAPRSHGQEARAAGLGCYEEDEAAQWPEGPAVRPLPIVGAGPGQPLHRRHLSHAHAVGVRHDATLARANAFTEPLRGPTAIPRSRATSCPKGRGSARTFARAGEQTRPPPFAAAAGLLNTKPSRASNSFVAEWKRKPRSPSWRTTMPTISSATSTVYPSDMLPSRRSLRAPPIDGVCCTLTTAASPRTATRCDPRERCTRPLPRPSELGEPPTRREVPATTAPSQRRRVAGASAAPQCDCLTFASPRLRWWCARRPC